MSVCGNAFTMALWRNLEKWVQRDFKVKRLLDRLHRVFTPTGEVATQWRAVVRALTTVVLEVMDRDVDEEGCSALFEQLYIMMLCLPILILRVLCKLSRKQGAAMVLERCARFLRGKWASLYANARCEVELANTRNREQDDGGAARLQHCLLDQGA